MKGCRSTSSQVTPQHWSESIPLAASKGDGTTLWLVWSEEHQAWWGPGEHGYTRSILAAGRYTEKQAKAIEDEANRYLRPDLPFHEIAMPCPVFERRKKVEEGA